MQNIAFYLEKYTSVGLKDIQYKRALVDAIYEGVGVKINSKQVTVAQDMIRVEVSGVLKSEIFIHQKKLQKIFENNLHIHNITKPSKKFI